MDKEKITGARLCALRRFDYPSFSKLVREALTEAGSIPAAAEALAVSYRTLYRWTYEDPKLPRGIKLVGMGEWTRHNDAAKLRAEDPAKFEKMLRKTLEQCGTQQATAEKLKISTRTLSLWLAAL